MGMVKICSCGMANSPSANLCSFCDANISGIRPEESAEPEVEGAEAEVPQEKEAPIEEKPAVSSSDTLYEGEETLAFVFSGNGRRLIASSGDILGREGTGKLEFADFGTVSRKHARIALVGDHWTIEDLQSTNGTWVNGKKSKPGEPCQLKEGDILSLSRSCQLTVQQMRKQG